MIQRLRAASLTAAIALLVTANADALGITSAQLHALAGRAAAGDAAALTKLRAVSQVDGRPARLAAALDAGTSTQLTGRLKALAASGASTASSPADLQATAASILAAQQYHKPPLPDPIGTVFHKLGRALSKLAAGTPGGPAVFWLFAGALVLALGALGARRMLRRLDRLERAAHSAGRPAAENPEALEQAARSAESSGAFAEAVRLRFRAGLLSLGARKAIEYRPSMLTTEVAARLHSAQFDALASTFERIAYGGAAAAESDAAAARKGWSALLAGRER